MSQVPLAQPPSSGNGPFDRWVYLLWKRVSSAGQLLWSYLDFSGSNITDIETRNHDDLQNLNTADHYHLTQANHTDLTDGGESVLHYHDSDRLWTNFNFTGSNITDIVTRNHDDLQNLNTANHYHLTQINHTDLTDGGDSTLHYHASDRARANHTGTQESDTVLVGRINGPTYSTLQHYVNLSQSAGQISGGEITSAGGTQVNIAGGSGWLRVADDNVSPLVFFDWVALNGVTIPNNTSRYIGVEYNAGLPQIVVKVVDVWDEDTEFQLGEVINDNGVIHIINDPWWVADSVTNIIQRFTSIQRIQRDNTIGGLLVGETGTRNITVSAGRLWSRLNDYTIPAINTSVSDTFDAYYRDGSGGFTRIAAQTQWPNNQYDDGSGILAPLGSNKYAVLWWYVETDGDLVMVYGRNQYTNAADAELEEPPATVPSRINLSAILVARLIFNEGNTTALSISSAFTTLFVSAAATDHNALSNLQGGTLNEYYHLTAAQQADLTDGGDSTLHFHSSDRARANHTGTQSMTTVDGLTTALAGKEPTIIAGTTAQYWRGDKSWQDFNTDVRGAILTGLSTATNAVITAADSVLSAFGKLQKQISDHFADNNNPHSVTKTQVGLGNVDNTSDATKPVSTAQQAALDGKENVGVAAAAVASHEAALDPHPQYLTSADVSTHNELSGLQGGTTGEYYHLTAAQVASLGVPTADILAFAASHG